MSDSGVIPRPAHNSKDKKDVTGMFEPRANALSKEYGWPVVAFDNRKPVPAKWADTKAAISKLPDGKLRTLVCLMHGWPHGLQFGLTRGAVGQFVDALLPKLDPEAAYVDFVWLACSTGEDGVASTNDKAGGPGGEGGLADDVADAFRAAGRPVRIWAHVSEGRADINPHMRVFTGEGVGGRHVIEPGSKLRKAWVQYLKDGGWAEFWTLTQVQLEAKLAEL